MKRTLLAFIPWLADGSERLAVQLRCMRSAISLSPTEPVGHHAGGPLAVKLGVLALHLVEFVLH